MSTGRLARYRLRLLKFEFEIVHWLDIYNQSADKMSRLSSKKDEEELVFFDGGIPTLNLQLGEKSITASAMLLIQDSAPMPTKVEMEKALNEDPYCRILQMGVGSELTWLLSENSLLRKRSAVEGTTQTIVLQKYRVAILHYTHYAKLDGHMGV